MTVEHLRQDIRTAEEYAAGIRRLLEHPDLPDELGPAVARTRDQAGRLLDATRRPYQLGVLGEFSAGKTMFIASLLGLEGLLIGDQPTTGNVTAYWVRQGPSGSRTVITGRQAGYLTETAAAQRRESIGQELHAAGRALSGPAAAGFEQAVWEAAARHGDGHALLRWHQTYADQAPNQVRRLSAQLVAIALAVREFGSRLGARPTISEAEANDLLLISERRPVSEPDPFWIVDHIAVTVEVAPEVLDLDRLLGDASWNHEVSKDRMVVYDFPGFLNDISGERDLTLTRTLLPDMDTVIALLKGGNPDGMASDELTALLREVYPADRRGRVLVGVGNLGDVQDIRRFETAALRQAQSDDEVLDQVPTLRKLLDTAGRLNPDDDPFFYSGLVALDHMGLSGSLDNRVGEAVRVVAAAGSVAAGLPQSSRLRTLLTEAARDGGKELVLNRLADRLAGFGLTARHSRVTKERAALDLAEGDLEAALDQASRTVFASAGAEAENLVNQVKTVLSSLKADLPPLLAETLGGGNPSLMDEIRADLIARVFAWPQWWAIMSTATGTELRAGPESTEEFVGPFTTVCHEVYATSRNLALVRWEQAVLAKAQTLVTDDLRRRLAAVDLPDQERETLAALIRPAEWRGILTNAAADLPRPDTGGVEHAFPMRRPHRFAWSIPHDDRPAEDAWFVHQLHPVHVIRLRQQVVDAADMVVRGWLDALRPLADAQIRSGLETLEDILEQIRADVVRRPAQAKGAPLLEELRKLRAAYPSGGGNLGFARFADWKRGA
ncbi:hypothetical protein [Herbidospora cretacea]|uniref:hypothetical protein n=1 Tax=Herbidospora cretacea TaxID=28444 RepID=UPI0004C442C4|nr:hypothetical protein [Herbidospora cretacea]